VFDNWRESPARDELPLARHRVCHTDEPPSWCSIRRSSRGRGPGTYLRRARCCENCQRASPQAGGSTGAKSRRLTDANGLFQEAVRKYKEGTAPPERVRVYEKIRSGIWVYNGLFELIDCWTKQAGGRNVFKFKLQFSVTDKRDRPTIAPPTLEDDCLIPSWVKQQYGSAIRGGARNAGRLPASISTTSFLTRRVVRRKTLRTFRYCVEAIISPSATTLNSARMRRSCFLG
jgi:hypothetical protein